MESLLPVLLRVESAFTRANALAHTAAAAARAGRSERALELAGQAESVVLAELAPRHPALAGAWAARALAARTAGDHKSARRWENKLRALARENAAKSWPSSAVGLKELGREPR
jgi:hypothetical protein